MRCRRLQSLKMEPTLHGRTLIQPFPVEGKAPLPLLPSMGRIKEGCSCPIFEEVS